MGIADTVGIACIAGAGIVGCDDPGDHNAPDVGAANVVAGATSASAAAAVPPGGAGSVVAADDSAAPIAQLLNTAASFPKHWVAVDADFTAQFPYPPQKTVQQIPSPAGTIKQTTYSSKVGLSVFQVITSDYDFAAVPSPSTVRTLLEEQALENLAQLIHLQDGTEISKGWVKMGGHDAYAFKVRVRRLDNGMHYWAMLWVERRMYQLIVHVPVDGGDTVHKDRFFNAFSP